MNCYEKLINNYNNQGGTIVYNGNKFKLKNIVNYIDKFASYLIKIGFKKNDVLTIYLPTCPQSLIAFYACSKIGVIANIVHPLVPIDSLKENILENKSKGLMFFDLLTKTDNHFTGLNQILIKCSLLEFASWKKTFFFIFLKVKKIKHFKNSTPFKKTISASNEIGNNSLGKGSDIVCRMHSGGTSGKPKIIELTNDALNNLSDNLFAMYDRKVIPGMWGLVLLPMFHAYGLGVSVHTCLVNKFNLVLTPKFSPKEAVRLIKKYKISFIAGIPIMFKKIMEQSGFHSKKIKYLRDLWCGGDIVSETDVQKFNEILKKYNSPGRLMRGYGLTEISSVCAVNNFKEYKKDSCGKPLPNTKIEIWDEHEKVVDSNQIGEIVVTNNSIMKGYLDGNGITNKNNINWVKTGDLGYLDDDGFLFVIGRKKRSIKINAINVFPEEIEKLVLNKVTQIDEACVVPYTYNNKTYIRLFCTIRKDNNLSNKELEKIIISVCKSHLIKYAVPHKIEFLDSMPRTKVGKINFDALQIM